MIEIENLAKVYHPGGPNEVRALRGVSMRLDRGGFLPGKAEAHIAQNSQRARRIGDGLVQVLG